MQRSWVRTSTERDNVVCHLGILQCGQRVLWTDVGNPQRGRIVDFIYRDRVPCAVVDVLPYCSMPKQIIVPIHDLVRLREDE